ncbi:hypothetical protein CTAYLR_006042 [Chrysophaeum taylorii]|uniref:Protein kinase domain-containing protein n=1 Tax=Chrysophaeum taylorii TaxID=2483200 RepID=A0AAD7UJQ8_9STRA|nr:hypothetical protein CTAYLR_006042 [Chrysophaeum taylorii]
MRSLLVRVLSLSLSSMGLLTPCSKGPPRIGGGKRSASKQGIVMSSTRAPAERLAAAGAVSAASVAAAAVNQAVEMSTLSGFDASRSYVAISGDGGIDEETGLPLSYDKGAIEKYWREQGSALQQRWSEFLRLSVPFLLRVATMLVQGGVEELSANDASLAREARIICEKLGPTFIKLAQTLSVRPDVLPPAALEELALLQDSVEAFDTDVAIAQIKKELEVANLTEVFAHISEEPVAAASLAQVYKAQLTTGEWVAVKVQRPRILEVVSKDLYVLRRAVEIYQRLMDRFAPQQKTNYVALLNEWAVGFYSELDFMGEVLNQKELRKALVDPDSPTRCERVCVPRPYDSLCTARLAVTEWVDGVKLSACPTDQIRDLTPVAQEAFLVQLLDLGVFHADPHPGNLLRLHDGRLALLDFGLVARVNVDDQDVMVSALIHLANRDYPSLVDDFVKLGILPKDTNRPVVVPLMDKALSPYVAGGGFDAFQQRVRANYGMGNGAASNVGGFQAMTRDALSVLNDVPFSIPPYFALLGRAIVTLEGIALTGDPEYALIQEAYPFVSRKLLSGDRPALRSALRDALYEGRGTKLNPRRLVGLVASAVATTTKAADGSTSAFFDAEALADAVDSKTAVATVARYVLSDRGAALRQVVEAEAVSALDVLSRQASRRAFERSLDAPRSLVRSVPLFGSLVPASVVPDPATTPVPLVVPSTPPRVAFGSPKQILDLAVPPLDKDDELYALDLLQLARSVLGDDFSRLLDAFIVGNASPFATSPILAVSSLLDLAAAVTLLADRNPLVQPFLDLLDAAPSRRRIRPADDALVMSDLLDGLDDRERAQLRDLGARVLERLAQKTTDRLQPFIDGRPLV